jgi:hypothetical protein
VGFSIFLRSSFAYASCDASSLPAKKCDGIIWQIATRETQTTPEAIVTSADDLMEEIGMQQNAYQIQGWQLLVVAGSHSRLSRRRRSGAHPGVMLESLAGRLSDESGYGRFDLDGNGQDLAVSLIATTHIQRLSQHIPLAADA